LPAKLLSYFFLGGNQQIYEPRNEDMLWHGGERPLILYYCAQYIISKLRTQLFIIPKNSMIFIGLIPRGVYKQWQVKYY